MENKKSIDNEQLAIEEILGLLPHRYPFALVDRVIEHIPGEKAVAIKNITINEPPVSYTHLTLPTSVTV